jgi:hypothetical protein
MSQNNVIRNIATIVCFAVFVTVPNSADARGVSSSGSPSAAKQRSLTNNVRVRTVFKKELLSKATKRPVRTVKGQTATTVKTTVAGTKTVSGNPKRGTKSARTRKVPSKKTPSLSTTIPPTTIAPIAEPTTASSVAPIGVATPVEVVNVGNQGTDPPVVVVAGDPNATTPTTVVGAVPPAITTTTLAPFPGPANPPLRVTFGSMAPYYGLGTWVDAFDWTIQKGGKVPKVSAQSVDAMAASGVQTIFIQASRFDSADVAEPERLLPIIARAHELGLFVVVWYLPIFTDVNADLRRTVAIANLDVDGISIDIEARNVADVPDRNRRLIQYSQALRGLLPGRFISNNIVQPNILEAAPNLWPTVYGKPPAVPASYWPQFPYVDIAPHYDLWMIQSYWTQRSAGGGWRDAYKISVDNANRLRSILARPDLPISLIGGVGDKPITTNDLAGFLQALAETKSVGSSFYDWLVTPKTWWPALWSTRYVAPGAVADPRFVPTLPPPYVAPIQPVLVPPTIPPAPPTVASTVPGPLPVITTTPLPSVVPPADPTTTPTILVSSVRSG